MAAIDEKLGILENLKILLGFRKLKKKSKKFFNFSIIHGVEFKNPYNTELEKEARNNRNSRA